MLHKHPDFQTPPTHGAFAKNGDWENAWIFTTANPPLPAEISAYIGSSDEVAFEAFFEDAFFGVRLSGEASCLERFALTAVSHLCSAKDGSNLFGLLEQDGYVSGHSVITHTEVGAVFAWKSVGPFKLDAPYSALSSWNDWWPRLISSQVGRYTAHKKAIEFVHDGPLPLWLGLPVCSGAPPYALSEQRLREALKAAIDSP